MQYIALMQFNAVPPRRVVDILLRLLRRGGLVLHRMKLKNWRTEQRQHQRQQSPAPAHIQYSSTVRDIRPSAEQNAVSADLHRAVLLIDMKLFKGKSAHIFFLNRPYFNRYFRYNPRRF